jgi:hypothetical protein
VGREDLLRLIKTRIHKFTMKTGEMALAAARIRPLPLIFVVAFFIFLPRGVLGSDHVVLIVAI